MVLPKFQAKGVQTGISSNNKTYALKERRRGKSWWGGKEGRPARDKVGSSGVSSRWKEAREISKNAREKEGELYRPPLLEKNGE